MPKAKPKHQWSPLEYGQLVLAEINIAHKLLAAIQQDAEKGASVPITVLYAAPDGITHLMRIHTGIARLLGLKGEEVSVNPGKDPSVRLRNLAQIAHQLSLDLRGFRNSVTAIGKKLPPVLSHAIDDADALFFRMQFDLKSTGV